MANSALTITDLFRRPVAGQPLRRHDLVDLALPCRPAYNWRRAVRFSDEVTAATAGLIWNPRWGALSAAWSVYIEASLSRWASRGGYPSDHGVLTQVVLVPVFRWRASQGRSAWFWEGGIGASVTSSVYRNTSKSFSTSFNFADNVGVGYSFGKTRENEVALRYQHFSNAGIKHPNPGQDFLQIRYVRQFD